MGTKKKVSSCRACHYLGIAQYEADHSVKWYACKHPEFKDMFSDGRVLDMEQEAIAPWCPNPEPRPPSAFEVMLVQTLEPNVVIIPEQECALCGVLDVLGFPDGDEEKDIQDAQDKEPDLVVSEHDNLLILDEYEVSALDGREREVEVSSEDGIFGKSPW